MQCTYTAVHRVLTQAINKYVQIFFGFGTKTYLPPVTILRKVGKQEHMEYYTNIRNIKTGNLTFH